MNIADEHRVLDRLFESPALRVIIYRIKIVNERSIMTPDSRGVTLPIPVPGANIKDVIDKRVSIIILL